MKKGVNFQKVKMFALVEFVRTSYIAIVPTIWLKGNYCYWPNTKDVTKLARAAIRPKNDWSRHKVTVKAIYAERSSIPRDQVSLVSPTYDDAKKHEKKYEDTSNLESTDHEELGRGKRAKKRKVQEQDSSSDDETQCSRLNFPDLPVALQNAGSSTPKCSFTITTDKMDSPPKEYEVIASQQLPLDNSVSKNREINENSVSLKGVLKEVLHIKVAQRKLSKTMHNILTTLNSLLDRFPLTQPIVNDAPALPVSLPLQSMVELSILETALSEDSHLKEHLCEKLSQVGGTSLGNAVRRMLMKLISNKLACCFSWLGIKGKEPFSDLKIAVVLISAVRQNPSFKNSSENDIETAVKDWLRHAKARCKE